MNSKGDAPDPQNADNVPALLSMTRVEARYNTWIDRAELRWNGADWVPLTDAELNRLRAIASREEYRFRPAKDFFRDMLQDHAREHRFDPVLDRIDVVVWDGQPRLATWLTEVCGVPLDPYHQAVSKNVIGGIVKRARHPGCRHDEMMILISAEQGVGKSTICRVLALEDAWHSDSFKFDGSPQNMIPQLFGKLVVECGELAGWSRKDAEDIKQFITSRSDNFTRKYEAFASDQPRRCIFIGTTNSETPLKDETGNRRFLPVKVAGAVNIDWLRANIWQLIAEAAHLETAGEDFSIPKDVWTEAALHQEAARDVPQHEELLQEWLGDVRIAGCGAHHIRSMDIGRAFDMAGLNSNLIRTIGATMRSLGYKRGSRIREQGQRGNRWVKVVGAASVDQLRLEPEHLFTGKPVTWRAIVIRG
jgi:predicted P-loop ATPase